jgi:hypothetical protein
MCEIGSEMACYRQQSQKPFGFVRPAATMRCMELDLNALAEAHLRNHRSSDKDKDFWAWKEVRRLIKDDPEAAWRITLLLLDKAESDAEVHA